ncbi:MAG: Mo-dependent nitrogenase C-terminal domain-containing protein [Xenococcaceae cyanobacterium]
MNILTLTKLTFELIPITQQWLASLEVHNPRMAHWICRIIPSQCPFKRQLKFFDRTIINIPSLCKLNPLYEQLVELRFKSLVYLVDECGEDINLYC